MLFIIDPIETLQQEKDTSIAIMRAAHQRGWRVFYTTPETLTLQDGVLYADLSLVSATAHLPLTGSAVLEKRPVDACQVVWMRQDPPVDQRYLYTTYLLETLKHARVLNHPRSVRDCNEKLFALEFADLCPEAQVTASSKAIRAFAQQHGRIVLKPLDGLGGRGVFSLTANDSNLSVVIETLTQNGRQPIMVQRYIPEISAGDKRLLMLFGQPLDVVLARVPAAEDFRGNMAAGATVRGQRISSVERRIAERVSPVLQAKGLDFVGLDIIGEYLTEINVTSPTGICQLNAIFNRNIADEFLQQLEKMA